MIKTVEYKGKSYDVWMNGGKIDRILVHTDQRYQRDGGDLGGVIKKRIPVGPTYMGILEQVSVAELLSTN